MNLTNLSNINQMLAFQNSTLAVVANKYKNAKCNSELQSCILEMTIIKRRIQMLIDTRFSVNDTKL